MNISNVKRITILENDQLHDNNPLDLILQRFINKCKDIEFTVWDWFSQDIIQNKEQSIKRLKELSEDKEHLFLAYPSFIGYDNTFNGWVYYLNQLLRLDIKLNLCLIYGVESEDLLSYVLYYYHDQKGYDNCNENRELLKNTIINHNIYYAQYDKFYSVDKDQSFNHQLFNRFKKLNLEDVVDLYFKKGEKIRIKETREIKEVAYVFYHKTIENSFVELIMDEKAHKLYKDGGEFNASNYERFTLNKVEKVKATHL